MHDFFSEHYEFEHGIPRRKRKRVLGDREHISFPYIADAAYGFSPHFSDGAPDLTHPNQKGFCFADVDDAAKLVADQAYEQMRTRLDYRHRQQGGASNHGSRPPTLDQLEQRAATAYAQRTERMKRAWRDHYA